MAAKNRFKHIVVPPGMAVDYEKPPQGFDDDKKLREFPPRDAATHGVRLKSAYAAIIKEEQDRTSHRAPESDVGAGTTIEFVYDNEFKKVVEKLESESKGIELLLVKHGEQKTTASVFVPTAQLGYFHKRIEEYTDSAGATKQKNAALVAAIDELRRAKLADLWNDNDSFPGKGEQIWWEVWLRAGTERGDKAQAEFMKEAAKGGVVVQPVRLDFVDRSVVLAKATPEQLAATMENVDLIAELRRARKTPYEIFALPPPDRGALLRDAAKRIQAGAADAVSVLVLDTGVTRGHPVLAASLDDSDMHTWNADWGRDDHHGHGTGMAGLALLGDLVDVFTTSGPIVLEHRLESAKISPPEAFPDPQLDGLITQDAIARAEISAPKRSRVMCLASTRPEGRDSGRPSSWSAALDAAAFGSNERKRLVIVSGGNIVDSELRSRYPQSNFEEPIQSPAQAWNALTVGGYTDKVISPEPSLSGSSPLAPRGGLAPSSTTSRSFEDQWALKPDVVMEAGNVVREGGSTLTLGTDGLSLLTTGRKLESPLQTFDSTSAATALASRFAAQLWSRYPQLKPETIRALMVHTAEWTPAMLEQAPGTNKADVGRRIRTFGFGVPQLERALYSVSNAVTLIAEDELQPFAKGASSVTFNEMRLFDLPWPRAALLALDAPVELRVTLSYFVEPSPGERGWDYRHRYPSHGLRFDVIRPTERDINAFRDRVSAAMREEDYENPEPKEIDWLVGPKNRHHGSLHHDRWTKATGAQLAECNVVAVMPVAGWWKERPRFARATEKARFTLIVSLHTPEATVDLYTPVATAIGAPIEIT